ncbi:Sec-independent protein translocase subunit TatA/TatB [Pedobacter nutrimenti]|uniref:Sec-independent protein translocase protein TatA n=1 Tax=Pedobacter nutrimenti TaxID=1241337 RepID=A0A318U8D4_9SPHI|nr:twin-arginine translocase TatA/TatE family subunit [Pedobacter nutrimenti]PYF70113.1 TatA/E family protein of Tat protein translocase [Pedobacter nutrimenti]
MYTGMLLEFLNMGGGEIMLILAVVLLLFGGKKLPELARGLGKGIRDFKDASEGVKREIHRNINSVDVEEEDRYNNRPAQPASGDQANSSANNEVKSDLPRETPIENATGTDHGIKRESDNKI